jgi:hypothetical protein
MRARFMLASVLATLPAIEASAATPATAGARLVDAPPTADPPAPVEQHPAAPADATASRWGDDRLREIHFDGGGADAELQARDESTAGSGKWTTICHAPCRARVPSSFAYRATGPGAPWSKKFSIGSDAWPLLIHTRPGSTAAKVTGTVLVPVGGVGLLLGFAGMMSSGRAESDRLVFIGLGVAGAAVLTTGIVLLVAGRTKVTLDPTFVGTAFSLPLGRDVTLSPAGLTF